MTELDALDALRQANPRTTPGFMAAVGTMTRTTKETLAVATAGAAAGGALGANVPAGPNRSGRWLLLMLLMTVGVVALVLLLLTNQLGSKSGSGHGQTATSGPSSSTRVTPTTTPTTATPTTATPTTATPTTAAIPPGTAPVTAVPASSGTNSTGHEVTTEMRTTPTKSAPTTVAHPTTVPSSPPTTLAVAPTCIVSGLLTGAQESVTVQDSGNGLASIGDVSITNGTVSIPAFARGTKGQVVVVATKTDPGLPTRWSFEATDVAGQTSFCH